MNTEELIAGLFKKDVLLWAEGSQLRYRAPRGILSPALQSLILENKNSILKCLEIQPLSFPLSFSQQRFWLLTHLESHNPAYNVPLGIRLLGELHIEALELSLEELQRRNQILRTVLPMVDGKPVQIAQSPTAFKIQKTNLREWPEEKKKAEALRHASKACRFRFDLEKDPLFRAELIELQDNDHLLLLTTHHTISDGFSMTIIAQEILSLYRSFSRNEPVSLPEPLIQYKDFARWQRYGSTDTLLEIQASYWEEKLRNTPSPVDLPVNRQKPEIENYTGGWQHILLPAATVRSLRVLSAQTGTTPFMVMLAALKILLFKWTNQTDLVIGTMVNTRHGLLNERLIGDFTNFLPLRSQMTPFLSGKEFLKELKGTVLEAYTNQDCPFESIVKSADIENSSNHSPLYNVLFLMQNFMMFQNAAEKSGSAVVSNLLDAPQSLFFKDDELEATIISTRTLGGSAMLDLRFEAYEYPETIYLGCEYRTSLFNEEIVKEILLAYQDTLNRLIDEPDAKLSEYALLKDLKKNHSQEEVADTYLTPVSETISPDLDQLQKKISGVFSEILGAKTIGLDDNFFALGGDSLMAVQLARRLEADFPGKEISTTEIFQFLTVRAIAKYLGKGGEEAPAIEESYERAQARRTAGIRRRRLKDAL